MLLLLLFSTAATDAQLPCGRSDAWKVDDDDDDE